MCFAKMSLERNLCFLGQRKTIPILDRFLGLSILVYDVVCLRYCLRLIIGTDFRVAVFEKILGFFENIVNWGDRVIVHFNHLLFKIVQLDQ